MGGTLIATMDAMNHRTQQLLLALVVGLSLVVAAVCLSVACLGSIDHCAADEQGAVDGGLAATRTPLVAVAVLVAPLLGLALFGRERESAVALVSVATPSRAPLRI